ncbi:hypothetical protein [Helicobacter aurati]|uniref:hypothetical protein n=1 Tax=Helicobacter aurati TaxID=137778 RepID=UPI00131554C6|nr:hypothetical protein [Helicobacter aurati]
MDKNFLKDEGNALLVQKHQLNQAGNKLAEVNNVLDSLLEKQKKTLPILISSCKIWI